MKRIIYIALIVSLLALGISVFIKPFIIILTKHQLEKVFADSAVSIGGCDFKPFGLLALEDINIKKPQSYDFEISRISIQYNPLKRSIVAIELEIDSFSSQGFQLKQASLKIDQLNDSGYFYVDQLRYAKAKIKELKSQARIKQRVLFLDALSCDALDGLIQGDLSLTLDKYQAYQASLKFVNLDLETLVHDFGLNKKVELSGKLTGRLNFQGAGLNLHALNGDFSSAEYGGRLIIKDTQFLENLARNSKQPLDIFVESFQDYEYNTGIIRLALDKGNLILDIALDGEAGKRNLNITLHDFRLKQEGL